jgi:hypothetical protein
LGGALLVSAQKTQPLLEQEVRPLCLIFPTGLGVVPGHLGARDVVQSHIFGYQPRRVWLEALVTFDRVWSRESCNDLRIALLQVPQVMQIAVAENDEATILCLGVSPSLFFADERVFAFRLRFEHHQREALVVQQKKVNETLAAGFEVAAHGINLRFRERDIGLQHHIRAALVIVKEAPASCFKQLVDFDTGLGFFGRHGAIVPAQ